MGWVRNFSVKKLRHIYNHTTAVFSMELAIPNFKNPQSINRTKYKIVTVIFHFFFAKLLLLISM